MCKCFKLVPMLDGKYMCDNCEKVFIVQPERSKREDSDDLGHVYTGIPTTEESWCERCGEEDHVIKAKGMRCSEQSGNRLREVQ